MINGKVENEQEAWAIINRLAGDDSLDRYPRELRKLNAAYAFLMAARNIKPEDKGEPIAGPVGSYAAKVWRS